MENLFLVTSPHGTSNYLVNTSSGENAMRIIAEEFEFDYNKLSYEEFYLGFGDYIQIDV